VHCPVRARGGIRGTGDTHGALRGHGADAGCAGPAVMACSPDDLAELGESSGRAQPTAFVPDADMSGRASRNSHLPAVARAQPS